MASSSKLIVALVCLIPAFLYSQQEVKHKMPQSELFFRAKALGFCVIEDFWLRSFSVGSEYRIGKQFAVSADYVHYRTRVENEVFDDPDNPDYYNEYNEYDARNYWAYQLKWYPQFMFDFEGVQPYLSLMYKVGGRKAWEQAEVPKYDGNLIGISGKFYDLGFVFGALTSGPIGGDIALGVRKRFEDRWEEYYHPNASSSYTFITEQKWNMVIRVNFYVKIFGWEEKN